MTERTVLCVGETMGLLTPTSDLRTEPLLHVHQAGAESNVAAGLAHLGVRSRWLSRVGDDDFGAIITDFLAARGVDTSAVVVDPERPTGLMVKTVRDGQTSVRYARAGSAASRLSVADLTRDALAGVGIIHLSGITPALSESTDRLAEAVLVERVVDPLARREVVVSFDVNHRARLWTDRAAAPRLQRLARAADIVLVGLDEAQDLWGCRTPEDVRDLLPEPARLVVKDGAVAAHEFVRGRSGDHRLTVPALHADVVEVVGAGDAFAAGYLAGLTTPTTPELVEGPTPTSPES
ncbi:MAG TPA: sugar kinase, partial [Candidatus Avipropionibacterium avicola]|nr:sugar kinase [Candidatus Avipropionibacterium avicola]